MFDIPKRFNLKKKSLPVAPLTLNGYALIPPKNPPTANSWGTWLQNQPAPYFKPGNRLYPLTTYLYGARQEYALALDQAERWGYALNIGYGRDYPITYADAATTNPVTNDGKLLRKAIINPMKYSVAGVVLQGYPSTSQAPEGYLRDSGGTVISSDWSPEATPASIGVAVAERMDALRKLKALGVNISVVYDGGETGLHPPGANAQSFYGRDPRVLAAKGNLSWPDYISQRKGMQTKRFAEEVAALLPDRKVYGFYTALANPYSTIPGVEDSGWDYKYMQYACDVPTGSVYYKDFFANKAGMTNPQITDRAYSDQLSHFRSAVTEQINIFKKPISYNFVSAGYKHIDPAGDPTGAAAEVAGQPNPYYMSIGAYKGFLKCMYALGSAGHVAGYFSNDVAYGDSSYTPYNPNSVPHWLLQQTSLSDVHARFSWFEDFIFEGDLVPSPSTDNLKPNLPSYEYPTYTLQAGFYIRNSARAFVRKLRGYDRWLIVLCTPELVNGNPGSDLDVVLKDLAAVGPLILKSRGIGSIYTVALDQGKVTKQHEDFDDGAASGAG